MKRVHVMTAAILTAVMSVGGAAMAQGPRGDGFGGPGRDGGPGGRGRGGLPIAALNLTQAQQDLVRDIRQRYSDELRAVETRSRAAHDAQRKAIEAIPLNEAAIRATTLTLAETQAEAAVLQARLQNEVFAALTPEQQGKVKELRAEREKRQQERAANAPRRK
jgi:Spy/CpxP family protein refolding chaperone